LGNILFVDAQGDAVWSCGLCDSNVRKEGDKITINGVKYVVTAVEEVVDKGKISYKITLR